MIKSKLAKKILAALTSLCLAATAAAPALMSVSAEEKAPVTPEAKLTLDADVGAAMPGDTITLTLKGESARELGGFQVTVSFDDSKVDYVGTSNAVNESGLMVSYTGQTGDKEVTDHVIILGNSNGSNLPALARDTDLAQITFRVKEGVTDGNLLFSLDGYASTFVNGIATRLDSTTFTQSASVAASADTSVAFTDVDPNGYYYQPMLYMRENGQMSGMNPTTFNPAGFLSRAQFVAIIYQMAGAPEVAYTPLFPDVPDGAWYTSQVIWGSQAEIPNSNGQTIIHGYDNGYFGPADNITREQLASLMYNYARYKGYDVSWSASLSAFPDGGTTSSWAQEGMSWAVAVGLFRGDDNGNLRPTDNASRADCAGIMWRFNNIFAEEIAGNVA